MAPPKHETKAKTGGRRALNAARPPTQTTPEPKDLLADLGNQGRLFLSEFLNVATDLAHVGPSLIDPDRPTIESSDLAVPNEPSVAVLSEFDVVVDVVDPTTFWTPSGTSREAVAQRVFGDRSHFGGIDFIEDKHVRLRSLDGVVADVAANVRAGMEAHLAADVDRIVQILCQRFIFGADERRLLEITVWWSSRSDFRDARGASYFDRYLDTLGSRQLTEERLWPFSDVTHTALEWLMDEAEEKAWEIQALISRRSSHKELNEPGFDANAGPLSKGATVGSYSFRKKRPKLAIGEWDYGVREIHVDQRIIDDTSSARAEIALRNTAHEKPRALIPGGDGHFYGYTIAFKRLEQNYSEPSDSWHSQPGEHIQAWWWRYPGTVVIEGDEFQPEFGAGGNEERAQRSEILHRALAGTAGDQESLDFDTLAAATFEERLALIDTALNRHADGDASLIARVLYSTPDSEFPRLERTMSTHGQIAKFITGGIKTDDFPMVGRVFTTKAIESMQVAGENLQHLPELTSGFDDEGYYHSAAPKQTTIGSQTVSDSDFSKDPEVRIGHERTVGGDKPGAINRTVYTFEPGVLRIGSWLGTTWRVMAGSFDERTGPDVGPLLPTQLVRVTILGSPPETHIVTAVEAVGFMTTGNREALSRQLASTIRGGMWALAGLSLLRAFGPAFAEVLTEGGGGRALAGALAEAAGTQAGRASLVNAATLAGMEVIESHRSAFEQTDAGREFLELYDITMVIWVSHDLTRLVSSGLVPRLSAAMDRVIAQGGALRDAVMPLRDEVEAMRRAISKSTQYEAAEAATAGAQISGMPPAESRPGFFTALRVARAEVASERLLGRLAGTAGESTARRVLGRLESLADRSETAAADLAADKEQRAVAARQGESAATARFAVAQRAMQLRPGAREAFLEAIDRVMGSRPKSLGALTDFLTAAAKSGQPNVFIREVERLVQRSGLSGDALTVLGRKVRAGTLDLAWLNGTSITDETLDFLGTDPRTPWSLYQKAATTPGIDNVMANFRSAARGAGAEIVAAKEAAKLSQTVRRQVPMGDSEIDFEIIVAGEPRGFEVKGWTAKTWGEALAAAEKRLNRVTLAPEEKQAVRKIDSMLGQLNDAQQTTKRAPYLGVTDALPGSEIARLRRVLIKNGLGATRLVPLGEDAIKEAAAGEIGETLGIPRP